MQVAVTPATVTVCQHAGPHASIMQAEHQVSLSIPGGWPSPHEIWLTAEEEGPTGKLLAVSLGQAVRTLQDTAHVSQAHRWGWNGRCDTELQISQ